MEARHLHVRHAADDQDVLHPPKVGEPRVIELPRKAVRVLKEHKQALVEEIDEQPHPLNPAQVGVHQHPCRAALVEVGFRQRFSSA